MKKVSSLILIIVVMCVSFVTAFAEVQQITVKVDGSKVKFPDQVPYIDSNNRTQVPIRFVSEALGAEVVWEENGQKMTVTIRKDTNTILLKIGESKATVNGSIKSFDTAATLKGNRTFVPLRFISETLGAEVNWVKETLTVEIDTVIVTDPIETTYKYNGYTFPSNHIMSLFDSTSYDFIDLSTQIITDKKFADRCDELEKVLESKFGKDTAKSVADYCRTKTDDMIELPVKTFVTSDKYTIEIYSNPGSFSISVVVVKPGQY